MYFLKICFKVGIDRSYAQTEGDVFVLREKHNEVSIVIIKKKTPFNSKAS